jgi:phage shock protein A
MLLLAAGLVAVLSLSVGRAQEEAAREMRERAEAMARKAEHLRDEGRHEDAEKLAREIDMLREKAERAAQAGAGEQGIAEALQNRIRELTEQWADAIAEHRPDVVENLEREMHEIARETGARIGPLLKSQVDLLQRRVAELREKGEGELAEQLAGRMREMVQAHRRAMAAAQQRPAEGQPGPDMERRGALKQRIHHLRTAAENLGAAGMPDLAERLHREAADLERQLQQPPARPQEPLRGQLEQLQQEVGRLHQRLDELQRGMQELTELVRRQDK